MAASAVLLRTFLGTQAFTASGFLVINSANDGHQGADVV